MRSYVILTLGFFFITPGHGWSELNITNVEPKPMDTTTNKNIEVQTYPFKFATEYPSFDKSVVSGNNNASALYKQESTTMFPPIHEYGESQNNNVSALYELINKEEYAMALYLSKQLKFPEDCEYVKSVVQRMLRDGNERVMKYAYLFKNVWSDENVIKNCFPKAFLAILSGKQARILTKDKTGALILSNIRDSWQDRWVYTESAGIHSKDKGVMWFFRESQFKSLTDELYIEIRNSFDQMNIKLDVNTQNQDSSRLAWGDQRPYDERYKWKIVPAGMDANDEPLFCFVDKVYKYTLKPIIRSYNLYNNNRIYGVQKPCEPNMAWIIETQT